jgi:outer membrane protein TolC
MLWSLENTMYPNTPGLVNGLFTRPVIFLAVTLFSFAQSGWAAELSLEEAGRLAIDNDYSLRALTARNQSMAEMAVASEQLPDPQLRVGFANLPVDTFNLGQEPMTQALIGVKQMFPRGNTRELASAGIKESISRNDAEAEDRKYQLLLSVREQYTRIYLFQERLRILKQSQQVFADLAEITLDYYATGRAYQQDVVAAQLEQVKVEERMVSVLQQEQQARARLSELIGADAYKPLPQEWPELQQPSAAKTIIAGLPEHPKMQAWQHEILKSKTSEDIARQAYKPGFAVDLAYGGRGGENPNGSSRSDLFSVMVSMDIPLFTKNRQDRVLAASIADTSATEFARDDIYRSMKARVEENAAALDQEQNRLKLYQEHLLPQATYNAEAAFEAYQNAVADLTTLMRARIGEYELKLSNADLRAEEIITRARLLYFQGETS